MYLMWWKDYENGKVLSARVSQTVQRPRKHRVLRYLFNVCNASTTCTLEKMWINFI